ncbi:MAG: hypothetical protein C0507_11005 [Cyanobacteria bacterium PR.3.49]|nr:hypothetical protein [Cyanobacteria bacterium PR.3.49]
MLENAPLFIILDFRNTRSERMAKLEAEFGLSLTEKGYLLLKSAIDWQSKSERSDYYFDVFDGRDFLLSKNKEWKWRIKDSAQGSKGEVSFLRAQSEVSLNDITLRISKRNSSSAGTKKKSLDKLVERTVEVVDFLTTSNKGLSAERVAEAAEGFNKELLKLGFLPEIATERFDSSSSTFALPAYWNEKKRKGLLIEFEYTNLEVFIEKKSLLDSKGREIFVYALEAEPESVLEPKKLNRTGIELIEFLEEVGLTAAHLNSVSPDPWAFVRTRLERTLVMSR